MALPPLLVAVIYLLYRDFDRLAHPDPPAPAVAAPAPPPPRAPAPAAPAPAASEVFGAIYQDAAWGKNAAGEGTSGSGSLLATTVVYRAYLQAFMKTHGITSVVDAGCGDWEFSHALDWKGIDYKGYDVVESVIARNKAKYSAPNIHFFVADIVKEDLPPADLLVSKHVLQHLPTADVTTFLGQLEKYRHVLLTNTVWQTTMSAENADIAIGEFRPLDPTRPPFNLRGVKDLTWWDGYHMHQVVHIARK